MFSSGMLFVLAGPSGAGKTTLAHHLAAKRFTEKTTSLLMMMSSQGELRIPTFWSGLMFTGTGMALRVPGCGSK